jgi:8-oxo-dGTP pyrophosphatase MutT (NUDIX family)
MLDGAVISGLIKTYEPRIIDAQERLFIPQYKALLQQCPDSFWKRRNFNPGHITASAWIVNEARTHTLLIHHRGAQMWFQPGGHIEPEDETFFAAVLREVREETGHEGTLVAPEIFDIDIHDIEERPERNEPNHKHFDIRVLVEVPFTEQIVSDDGVLGIQWVALADVHTVNATASLSRMVAKMNGVSAAPQRSTSVHES